MCQKICSKCQKSLDLNLFYKCARYADGYRSHCKDCISNQAKNNRESNQEREKNRYKKYYQEHKEEKARYQKEKSHIKKEYDFKYYRTNKFRILNLKKERLKNNIDLRIKHIFRSRLKDVIKGKSKTSAILEYLGCSYSFLIQYLESKFEEGMTWDNYGNPNGDHSNCWHIDHIIPVSSMGTDENSLRTIWHYTNLQPLWAKDNLSKGAKINP